MNADLNIQTTLQHVNAEWSDETAERALLGLKQKQRRRKIRRTVALSSAASLLVSLGAFWLYLQTDRQPDTLDQSMHPSQLTKAASRTETEMLLADGSRIIPRDASSRVEIEKDTQADVRVRISDGGARFVVTPNTDRTFLVRVENVLITVHGTIFLVERTASQVSVAVEEGLVQVTWHSGERFLPSGESDSFPLKRGGNAERAPNDSVGSESALVPGNEKRKNPGKSDWRFLAQKGEFEAASKMIAHKGDVRDTVDDLLLAADAMRLSGKPKKGLSYLGQIVANHRDDPRAVLAEFTRGRILISQLGRPREAVAAFRHVQKMAPNSSLAEDALAREVESWYLLGEQGHARERALLYTKRYPSGRRTQAVRQYGGIE